MAYRADMPDDELIRLHCDGDADAFDALFERHHVSVYNLACLMLRNEADANEVLQDTFLAVARTAGSYQTRGKFRAWLIRIARNQCLNRLESRRVRQQRFVPMGFSLVEPPAPETGPSEALVADEQSRLVQDGIARLPERQREALCLYTFEHMAYHQVAEALDTPINTVKTLIRRARIALAKMLVATHKEAADDL